MVNPALVASGISAAGSIAGSLLGSDSSQESTSSKEEEQQISRGSGRIEAFLADILENFDKDFDQEEVQDRAFSRSREQVSGILESIFRDFQQTTVPQVFNAQRNSGVFGSSSAQQIADRAFADATARASEVVVANANTNAGQVLQNRQLQQQFLSQLFGIDLESTGRTTTTGNSRSTGSGNATDALAGINTFSNLLGSKPTSRTGPQGGITKSGGSGLLGIFGE